MVEEVKVTQYKCSICQKLYESEGTAKECEKAPVTQDKGIKINDIVLITHGQGEGKKARVTNVWVLDKYWGHYAWQRYWHTVALTAKVIGDWGSRFLTFDSYERAE